MLTLRPSSARGRFDLGWLDTRHTFSFGHYHDPEHMAFGPLRVINEDVVAPGQGFPTHPHREMEIITVVLSGALEHKDSTGASGVIRPGDVQHMTAGRGVRHSEFNPSRTEPVHLLQIWIMPRAPGLTPAYSQQTFDEASWRNRLQPLASPDGRDGSLIIQQDATMLRAALDAGASIAYALDPGRAAWVQIIRGEARVNSALLSAGDGAAITDEGSISIDSPAGVDLLLFDLPR